MASIFGNTIHAQAHLNYKCACVCDVQCAFKIKMPNAACMKNSLSANMTSLPNKL